MKKNVALIDDDEGPILYYQMVLEDAGFNVIRLRSFNEALEFISQPNLTPDFWVIDVMMSVYDGSMEKGSESMSEKTNMGLGAGLFLYQKIKESSPRVPAVLLTSISTPALLDDIERALKGDDSCESKLDVLPQDLINLVERRLKR